MAEAHLARIVTQIEKRQQGQPPEIVRRANQSRPKVIDISFERPAVAPPQQAYQSSTDPLVLLQRTSAAIDRARFTGNADKAAVQRLLFKFEWSMNTAVETVLAQGNGGAALTVRPGSPKQSGTRRWAGLSAGVAMASAATSDVAPFGVATSHAANGHGRGLTSAARRGSAPSGVRARGDAASQRRGSAPAACVRHCCSAPLAASPQEDVSGSGPWLDGVQLVRPELLSGANLAAAAGPRPALGQSGRKMSGGYI